MTCAACGLARCRCVVLEAVAEAMRPERYPLPPRVKEHRRLEARLLVDRLEASGLRVVRRRG